MEKMSVHINRLQININSASVAVILGLLPLLFLSQLPNKSLQLWLFVIFCLFLFIPFYLAKFIAVLAISFLWGMLAGILFIRNNEIIKSARTTSCSYY
ncbi:hypothetical protein [Arsenophonus endosymbiont of Aleurodicus floccissimus]|uniref:hypothetical protein n=1 Tax=Arsenophonus endosymbiont of Aleurodicus floccissimus TaxID=2152761 RepID=UPI000E6B1FA4|nr:hypothetical protein [Arsenophonus endosymbiont of Aleurodicus floccissimus]